MTLEKLRRTSSYVRVPAIGLMAIATVGFVFWKRTSSAPLLGLSSTFDSFVVALSWVFVLWLLGYFRQAASAPPVDKTLDSIDWHLDGVRSASLPEERAANVGGAYLSWLVARGHLNQSSLVGLDESIEEHRADRAGAAVLYEDLGGKLTTSLVSPAVVAFTEQYLDPRAGEFFDDLELVLGPDPFEFALTPEHLHALHEVIDERLRVWKESA